MRFDYAAAEPMRLASPSSSLGVRAVRAETTAQRALGLTGAELARLPADGAVLFDRCQCVHTFGMRGPIALAWIGREREDGSREIVSIDASIPPRRVVAGPRGAVGVLEMNPMGRQVEEEPPELLTREGQIGTEMRREQRHEERR